MMAQELREFYQCYVTAANARDFEAIADMLHDDVKVNGVSLKREDVLESLKGFVAVVPDFTWHIEDLMTDGGRIAARLRDTGTPAETWLGIEAAGMCFEITEFANYRVRDGRFAEMWFLMDVESASQQLRETRPVV